MGAPQLLTRDEFREGVFARDAHKCVLCGAPSQDAHHIMERRLWGDSGYYLDNGVSVCGPCHLLCEQTVVSCDTLREKAGITRVLLPPHLYQDQPYDKWGNPLLPGGLRMYGELSDDPSVQKILKAGGITSAQFDDRVKYPRTYHLPWSPGATSDDRILTDLKGLTKEEVVVTLKLDGENTTMTPATCYARSRDTQTHWSRDWVRSLHGRIAHEIPQGWRICGENLFAVHSIEYRELPSYFIVFGVWDGLKCLAWLDTCLYAQMLGLTEVTPIYRGAFNENEIKKSFQPYQTTHEGYVVRPVREFHMSEYRHVIGKFVRKDHVQTHAQWMRQEPKRNGLAKED